MIDIEQDIPASAQESSFMNATLQGAPSGLAFSIAVHVRVPETTRDGEKWDQLALATHLRNRLSPAWRQEGIDVTIQVGPEDRDD